MSEMDRTSNRFIKLSTYASCDSLIVPSSTSLSMPHSLYHVHSPEAFVGNVLFRYASNDSQSSSDPPFNSPPTTTTSTIFRIIHGSALHCSNPSAFRVSVHKCSTCAHFASGHELPSLIWRSCSTVHRNLLGVSCTSPCLMMYECTPGGYVKVAEWESILVCYD